MLENSETVVRRYAAFSLGHIGSDQTPMKPLYTLLEQDPADEVRGMAAFAIAAIVNKEDNQGAMPYLLRALQDKFPQVRSHAVIGLGKIGHTEGASAILATTLDDPDPRVRHNSIWALGKIGGNEIVVPLVKKLRDPLPAIQQAAYTVLKAVTRADYGNSPAKWEEKYLH
jgi:HEAT repeat protein